MQMTAEEIRTWYRDAKDKEQSITILSDMNLVPKGTIRQIVDGDVAKVAKSVKERKYFRWSVELFEDLKRLYAEKLAVGEIAERLGLPYEVVKSKIASESFKPFRRRRSKKQQTSPDGVSNSRQEGGSCMSGIDETYIKHLEGEFAKCKVSLNEANQKIEALLSENEKLLFRANVAEMAVPSLEAFWSIVQNLFWVTMPMSKRPKRHEVRTFHGATATVKCLTAVVLSAGRAKQELGKNFLCADWLTLTAEEIRSIADCIHAVDADILDSFESIIMQVCRT